MKNSSLVVIDLGGTKINYGRFRGGEIEINFVKPFDAKMSVSASINFIKTCIDEVKTADTSAIAIGVPSIVNVEKGIVFDAANINSWQEVALKDELEQLCQLPVYVNNDVNCFVKGEHVNKQQEQDCQDMVGMCLGTGLGAGIVLQDKVYAGVNGCAGEVGNVGYLDSCLDSYCSGQFFKDHFQECGATLAEKARSGDHSAIKAFEQFGKHVGAAISHLLLILDPQIIVLGGSVAKSFDLFIDSLWQSLSDFPYKSVTKRLIIEQSTLENSALLGAAYLYLESLSFTEVSHNSTVLEASLH